MLLPTPPNRYKEERQISEPEYVLSVNIVATGNTFTKSSYLIMDGNYLKVYDKFNDQYIEIPASSSTAGIMAATDLDRGVVINISPIL